MTSDKVWGEYPVYFKQPIRVCIGCFSSAGQRWKNLNRGIVGLLIADVHGSTVKGWTDTECCAR